MESPNANPKICRENINRKSKINWIYLRIAVSTAVQFSMWGTLVEGQNHENVYSSVIPTLKEENHHTRRRNVMTTRYVMTQGKQIEKGPSTKFCVEHAYPQAQKIIIIYEKILASLRYDVQYSRLHARILRQYPIDLESFSS